MQYAVFSHFRKVTTPSECAVLSIEGSSSDQKGKKLAKGVNLPFLPEEIKFLSHHRDFNLP